jgi:predicted NBD/HSP70 family sugar kinase
VRAVLQQLADATGAGRSSTLHSRSTRPPQLSDILRAAGEGDRLVVETLRRAATALGEVICQLSLLLNPKQIVIAGPLAALETTFLAPIREAVAGQAPPLHAQAPEIVGSMLGDFGGALGAAAIALHEFAPAR